MNEVRPPLSENDYEAIEAAVMETERGRWFLAEYAARNRNSDTDVLLNAIKKLESSLLSNGAGAASPTADQIRFDLVEMAAAIAQTKREIAQLRSDDDESEGILAATEELDAIVVATETATQAILEAAEQIQEITWTMRENGVEDNYCEALDNQVTEIYTTCSFQDITGQRTSKVVAVLHYLESRLEAMRHIWGGDDIDTPAEPGRHDPRPDSHLLNGPQLDGKGHDQDDVDLMMSSREALYDAVVSPAAADDEADPTDGAADEGSVEEAAFVEQTDENALFVEEATDDEPVYGGSVEETALDEPADDTTLSVLDDETEHEVLEFTDHDEDTDDNYETDYDEQVTAAATALIAEAVGFEEEVDEETEYKIIETVAPQQLMAPISNSDLRPSDLDDEDKLALFS